VNTISTVSGLMVIIALAIILSVVVVLPVIRDYSRHRQIIANIQSRQRIFPLSKQIHCAICNMEGIAYYENTNQYVAEGWAFIKGQWYCRYHNLYPTTMNPPSDAHEKQREGQHG